MTIQNPTSQTQNSSAWAIFRNRNFTLLWLAEFISQIGTALSSLAASIWVFQLTGSTLSVGLMLMASAAPSLFVGLVAGVFVDRIDRRRVMIAADLIRAAIALLIPFLLPHNVAWLYILVLSSNAVGQFFTPANASLLPEIATDEELTAANSFMAISAFGSMAVGFAASGFIAGTASIEWAFYLDALSFVLSALLIYRVKAPKLQVGDKTTVAAVLNNLRDGVKLINGTTILRSFFLICIPICILMGLTNTLLLPFAIDELHATEFQYGLLEGVALIGFTIGSLLMARLGDRLHEGQWLVIANVGMALMGMLLALLTSVPFAMLVNLVSGIFNAPVVVARSLIIQRNTPREARGRVFSAFFVTRDTAFMGGMALAGLGDLLSVRALLLIGGALSLGLGLVILKLPGLAQPAAEWRRTLALLRHAPSAPGLGTGRLPMPADFDLLATRIPALARLDAHARQHLLTETRVVDAPEGTVILRQGDHSDAAYFILQGRAVAGRDESGEYRVLEVMTDGDFFGEIAALTGSLRTANVVAAQPTTLLEVPAATLHRVLADPELNRLFVSRMTARMLRSNMMDVPRFGGGKDQDALLDLRTPQFGDA